MFPHTCQLVGPWTHMEQNINPYIMQIYELLVLRGMKLADVYVLNSITCSYMLIMTV